MNLLTFGRTLLLMLVAFSAMADTTSVQKLNDRAWAIKFSNPDSACLLAEQALKISNEIGFKSGKANALKNIAVVTHIRGSLDSSFHVASQAVTEFRELNDTLGIASSLNLVGIIQYSLARYPEALEVYLQVARLYEAIGDQTGLAKTYNNIGNTFYKQEYDDNALRYYEQALQIYHKHANPAGQMEALANVGLVLMEKKKFADALTRYKAAEAFAAASGNNRMLGNIWQNIAICFRYQNLFTEAEEYYTRSLRIKRQLQDADGICSSLIGLAIISREKKSTDNGLAFVTEAISISKSKGLLDRLSNAYEIQYDLLLLKKDFESALDAFRNFSATRDSLFNIAKTRQLTELQLKYETQKKEQQIILLTKENELEQARKNRAIIIGVAITLLLASAVYGIGLRNKLYKERNEKLSVENRLREEENLRLAEELKSESEINRIQAEKHLLEIDFKNRELTTAALHAVQKNEIMTDLKDKLEELRANKDLHSAVKPLLKVINNNLTLDDDWQNTKMHFEQVHPGFFERLQQQFPELTQNELKHIAYMKINLSGKEIARLLNIGVKAIQMSRYRIKKKIGLPEEVNLVDFIQNF